MYKLCQLTGLMCPTEYEYDVLTDTNFIEHVAQYGLSYGTQEEYRFRLQQYSLKDAEIKKINAEQDSYTVGHNFLSTWTHAEYKRLLGYKPNTDANVLKNVVHLPETTLDSIDWRQKGAVNKVQNQGKCGSCWAFSATMAMEGVYAIKHGELRKLSEQQLVSCDDQSRGCNGGLPSWAFKYLENNGHSSEDSYKYESGGGWQPTCDYSKFDADGPRTLQYSPYTHVPSENVAQLKAALAKQPVSFTVSAESTSFSQYSSGILDSDACGTRRDHAVGGVGYGTEGDREYWIIRNSYGTSWGEAGYVRIKIQAGRGICGCQQTSDYPNLA